MPPPQGYPNFLEGPGDYTTTPTVHSDTYPFISPLTSPATQKSVFIAGASRGLGLALATSYAQSGASQIAIGARSSLSSIPPILLAAASAAGRPAPKIITVSLDVSSPTSVGAAADLVKKEFGKLDVLCINAGVIGRHGSIGDSDPDVWWQTMATNLRGPYLLARAFVGLLAEGEGGQVVTTSSVGAFKTTPGMSGYQLSKMAVLRLMEFVAAEYKDKGVTAWCVHPGNVMTDMVMGFEGGLPKEAEPIFCDTPQISADTIVFLTREKREWLSGRYINCTWDMEELIGRKDEIVERDMFKLRLVV